jgi:DNA-directed RNA polymerase sigma subunit (sigma70/sigma32)
MCEPSSIENYESRLGEISDVCSDPWFHEQLSRYRSGDETALRCISERCLGRVFVIAKEHWRPGYRMTLLDLVQEGNAALVQAIDHFRGATAVDFLREMTALVEHEILRLLRRAE